MAYVDSNGSWLKVNARLCEILEYTEIELQSRTFQQVTHPDDIHDDVEMLDQLRRGKISFYLMSKRYITKTGKVIWIKLKSTRIEDENGNFIHFMSQIQPAAILSDSIENFNKSGEQKDTLFEFIKKDWKWILVTSVMVLGFIINKSVEYYSFQQRLERNTVIIENILQEYTKD